MAGRVIIVDAKRAREDIPASELCQMAGRVGRSHTASVGYVDVVVGDSELEDVRARIESPENFVVESILVESAEVAFHIMPEITNRIIRTKADAEHWYGRSFAAFCGARFDFEAHLKELESLGMVVMESGEFVPTELGKVCSKFYLSPHDVFAWRENFTEVFGRGIETEDAAVAWALSNVASEKRMLDVSSFKNAMYEMNDSIKALDLEFDKGILPMGAVWMSAMGGLNVSKMTGEIERIRREYGRINEALLVMNDVCKWDMSEFFHQLHQRIKHKIPAYLVPLYEIKTIKRAEAQELYNLGVTSIYELEDYLPSIEATENTNLIMKVKMCLYGVQHGTVTDELEEEENDQDDES